MSLPAGPMISLTAALEGICKLWPRNNAPREVPVADFVTGNHANILAPGELLRSIFLPASALKKNCAFRRFTLTHLGRSESPSDWNTVSGPRRVCAHRHRFHTSSCTTALRERPRRRNPKERFGSGSAARALSRRCPRIAGTSPAFDLLLRRANPPRTFSLSLLCITRLTESFSMPNLGLGNV